MRPEYLCADLYVSAAGRGSQFSFVVYFQDVPIAEYLLSISHLKPSTAN